ncbi:hypothetical protein OUZ56_028895 [Daphnia magna]|uniref:Double-stranded RNA-specific editase Adar n=1 Tax=Daphnia magna TaxID=35525 RepID=A0ABR0B589_9CRUS|nr:hypothetical protein OUZ56_028895 [Daphnia magna]
MEALATAVSRPWNSSKMTSKHDDSPPKKKRKKSTEVVVGQKNPVMVLNEIKPNIEYDIAASGPPHARIYSASVTVNGKTYTAEDTTKKKAKARVAQMILLYSVQLKDPSVKAPLMEEVVGEVEDFSKDLSEVVCDSEDFFYFESAVTQKVKALPLSATNNADQAKSNPVFYLNRLKPGVKIEIVNEAGSPHMPIYTARVVIDDQTFEGTGSSKKQAKNEAAQTALQKAFNLERTNPPKASTSSTVSLDKPSELEFGDFIARQIESTYQKIMKDEQPSVSRYKVLAGVVMTVGPTADGATVICVTTGSKCINGGQLSMEGEALNDCHAEVLARRGLVSFLYDQLNTFNSNPSESIFERSNGNSLKLKNDVLFHLYVSSAPCGDARIFTLNESLASPLEDLHPNRQGRGALRTKIESGEGTVPVNESAIQTWDGILQGERLLTMSCSDKLARWNIVGVQGSVLSNIIDPIYFHTIVVGSLYHQVHLRRALIGRIEHLQGLPSPFIFSRPVLSTISTPPDRLPAKSPKNSVIWIQGWPEHEVVEISKGKLLDGSPSRLSKRHFFYRFVALACANVEHRSLLQKHVKNGHVTYLSLKQAAQAFGEAKEMLQSSLVIARLGQWIKKPLEQDSFEIPFDGSQLVFSQHSHPDRTPSSPDF